MSGLLSVQFGVYKPLSEVQIDTIPVPKSFSATVVNNRAAEGALSLEVAKNTHGVDWLLQPCEFALQAKLDQGTFKELPNLRFLNVIDSHDLSAPQGSTITVSCLPLGWLFNTALVYPLSGQPASKRPFRKFKNKTVGEIWNTLLYEAQQRGNLKGIRKNWTNAADSNGKSWGATHTEVFNVGDTLLDVLDYMCSHGMANVRFRGRLFELLKPGTLDTPSNRDVLRIGQDILSIPRRRDRTTARTHALGIGNEAVYASSVTNSSYATSESPWGRWDVAINVNGDTFSEVSEATKRKLYKQWGEYETDLPVNLSLNPKGPIPFFDYQLGDYLGLKTGSGQIDPNERYKVDAITLTRDSGSGALGATINLGKKHVRSGAALARRLKDLERDTRGAIQLAGQYASAAGSPPSPTGEIKFKPANQQWVGIFSLQNDPDLFWEVAADATYRIEGMLAARSNVQNCDIALGWSVPAGAAGRWCATGYATNIPDYLEEVKLRSRQFGESITLGLPPEPNSSEFVGIPITGAIKISATAGTLQFRWCNGTGAGTTIMEVNSWMHVWRVA